PREGGQLGLDERIALAEAFYRRRGALCRFQICPASRPAGLDAALEARGYTSGPATLVQTAPLAALLPLAAGRAGVAESFDEAWLAAYAEGEGETSAAKIASRREMLGRIGPPAGFAALREGGRIAAVALGVVERGHLGIFSVATAPAWRGRGLARAALGDLAAWAGEHGAHTAYLQVFSANAPALRLYERLGFGTLYQYWYREKTVWAG
ncbi:MAG TPA: GNAT family N-acetyltransferase, partial [Chloroflexaceae bacterium]|nr:GNAT family N-acetyltransferase [Chloroflexaceae bacterium]